MNRFSNSPDNHPWVYQPFQKPAIVLFGRSSGRVEAFLAIVVLAVDPEEEKIEDMKVIASRSSDDIEEFDYQSNPVNLFRSISQKLQQTDRADIIDITNLANAKFQQFFSTPSELRSIARDLREEKIFEVEEQLREFVEHQLFMGESDQLQIRITHWLPETSGEASTQSSGFDSSGNQFNFPARTMLEIQPCLEPVFGTKINRLFLEDELVVRIVGKSAELLNPALLDRDNPSRQTVSRPIPARLVALKRGDLRGEIQFWTSLKDDVFGYGVQASETQVKLHRRARRMKRSSKIPFYLLLIFFLLFFFSLFLLFIGVPELFFVLFAL